MKSDPTYKDAPTKNAFQDGLEFQDFVVTTLARQCGIVLSIFTSRKYQYDQGETLQGAEIKLDERCTDTGRLSIEVAEKTRDDPTLPWTPSGIMRSDNTWLYVQGNRKIIFIFAKKWLLLYHEKAKPDIIPFNGTIKRFFLPFAEARRMAVKVIELED